MHVTSVNQAARHVVRKAPVASIHLRVGLGAEGDAHSGALVQHRYDRRRDPSRPNLRQVHLLGAELLEELERAGYRIAPGDLGENITTGGIDLASLPAATRLRIGSAAVVELTGVREPCVLLDRIASGLRVAAAAERHGEAILRHGAMAIVLESGEVRAGDAIEVSLPPRPHRPMRTV
jgi:MOSC domain-containing protein YiiM